MTDAKHPKTGPKQCSYCAAIKDRSEFKSPRSRRCAECSDLLNIQTPVPTKFCPRCNMVKPAVAFHRNRNRRDGLQNYCTECLYPDSTSIYVPRVERYALIEQGLKICSKCREVKPLEDFARATRDKSGRQSSCRACFALRDKALSRASMRRSNYGLSDEDFQSMLAAQGGGCAVCGSTEPGGSGSFHVDHDHSCCPTKKTCGKCVRGLLCSGCNCALGYARDSVDRLVALASYLIRTETASVDA